MNTDDRPKFLEVVLGFAELKGKQLSKPALELYWRAMRDWPLQEFLAAADHLLRTCEFMPTPKDFEDLRNAQRPMAAEAWAAALSHAAHGRYRRHRLDELTETVVRAIGGWQQIAMCPTDKLQWVEKRFLSAYEEFRDTGRVRMLELTVKDVPFALPDLRA